MAAMDATVPLVPQENPKLTSFVILEATVPTETVTMGLAVK
jgi:hypothetical protein